jgi:regulator of protease activity HflC (stomatin/prohibitin superfamily)
MSIPLLITVIICGVIVGAAVKYVRDNERVIVFRFKRLIRTLGPGIHLIIPFVDRPVCINLDEHVPGWRNLSEEQVEDQTRKAASEKNRS